MSPSRFQIAKKDIISAFANSLKSIFAYSDISRALAENREFWRLPASLTTLGFIRQLTDHTKLNKFELEFPSKKLIRYAWKDIDVYGLAQSLEKDSYFTHYTAIYLHNLTEQIPKTVYVNTEQPKKSATDSRLTQIAIDKAFKNPQRVTNTIAKFNDYRICLLNGKNTNRLGVVEMVSTSQEKVWVTDIERTLIDIVVRPAYSGGIYEVLKAYRNAATVVSINRLVAMLLKMKFIYPYHQAIGFYLQTTGMYTSSQIGLLKEFPKEFDFYLTNEMRDLEYNKEWRLYYPRGFNT